MNERQIVEPLMEQREEIDRIAELVDFSSHTSSETKEIDLPHSRKMVVNPATGRFTISSKAGAVELQVKITPEGPVLIFNQSHIELNNTGNLNIQCKDLNIKTEGKMKLESGADFTQSVAGNYEIDVRDDAQLKAQSLQLNAELGELGLNANDDIALNGLRILMNVPTDEELAEKKKNLNSFQDLLKLPFVDETGPKRMPTSGPIERKDWENR